jgi:dinuclear metal center YbgI/SA1388 family protein
MILPEKNYFYAKKIPDMKLSEITDFLEGMAPKALQESYDNNGLLIGRDGHEIDKALICLDLTEAVIDEAVQEGAGLVISHHPLIFGGLKNISGRDATGRVVMKAIKNNVAVYAIHTNLDNAFRGVNAALCDRLGLTGCRILRPAVEKLRKLVTFCPASHAGPVREALFAAGAGHIGNYDSCSYNIQGHGTFRAGEGADPFVGGIGELHTEPETRIEVVFPAYIQERLLGALHERHPYEEVAYDIYPLMNDFGLAGAGMTGSLEKAVSEEAFLLSVKKLLGTPVIRHSRLTGNKVRKVAVCGGSGSFLIPDAIRTGADVFVTADIKYHQFFEAEGKMLLADAGHYETEQFAKDLLYKWLNEKFPTFALRISECNTNAVHYL